LKRLERKRKPAEAKVSQQPDDSGKRTTSDLASISVGEEVCFFCGGPVTEGNPLCQASTTELDSRDRAVVMEVKVFNLFRETSVP